MYQYENDEKAVHRQVASSFNDDEPISDGTARTLVSLFNEEGVLNSFVTTGWFDGDIDLFMHELQRLLSPRDIMWWSEEFEALERYLEDRVDSNQINVKFPGWATRWVTKHVDYPHADGMLHDCWCFDEYGNDDE